MSTHIGAEPGQIAPTVLLPGDPLRARWIAETFLDDATCYSEVRGMYGFTGTWHGQPVSVQGSGMGQPSMAIYVNELFERVRRAVGRPGRLVRRADRAGRAARRRHRLRRVHRLLDEPAALPRPRLRPGGRLRPAAGGVRRGRRRATTSTVHVGLISRGDSFYTPRPELIGPMVEHGVLAVEMEASALYTLAAVRPQGAGDLHRLRPHRHRRGDHRAGARADLRRDGRDRARPQLALQPELTSAKHRLELRPVRQVVGTTTSPLRT